MPAADLDLLIRAAIEAGDVAGRFNGKTARVWDKPGDAGPVSEADIAVNEQLQATLRTARPDYGWLSEESDDGAERLGRDLVFIIDPIDGTRSFIEGSRTWAHSIAVAERGEVRAAVVYLPQLDKLYAASSGGGATLNDAPIHASRRSDLAGAQVLAARPAMEARHWAGPVPDVRRSLRPSLAYRLSLVAEGRYDAMLTLRRSWEWDIAAGDLILREAGAITSDRTGAALRFNNPDPRVLGVVAGGAAVHKGLTEALAPAED